MVKITESQLTAVLTALQRARGFVWQAEYQRDGMLSVEHSETLIVIDNALRELMGSK